MLELTAFGAAWLALLLVLFFLPLRYMATALLLSAVFQAAAVVNAGGKGLMPLLVTEVVFLLRWGLGVYTTGNRPFVVDRRAMRVLAFCGYACVASAVLPLVFGGLFVPGIIYQGVPYPQAEQGFGALVGLGRDNWLKIISVLLHGATLLVLLCARSLYTARQLAFGIKLAIVCAVLVGVWETAAKQFAPAAFPESFFYSNAGYTMKGLAAGRTNFTFTEPSYAGGFFSAALVGTLAARRRGDMGVLLLLTAAFALSLAGTSVVTFLGGLGLLFLLGGRGTQKWQLPVFLAFLLLALLFTGYLEPYARLVLGKMNSFSGRERVAGILYGLRVFAASHGLGVGMGTVRTFSLVSELLSSLGVLGLWLFCAMTGEVLKPLYQNRSGSPLCRFCLFYMLTHLLAQCVALPDITTPTLWFGLFGAACAANAQWRESRLSDILPGRQLNLANSAQRNQLAR